MLDWLKEFLPQPKPLIGLDIGKTGVAAVQLDKSNGEYQVTHFAIADSLPELCANLPAIKDVAVAIPDSLVIRKIMRLDAELTENEIETYVLLEADKYISYPLEDVYLDFHVKNNATKSQDIREVQLIAARKDRVDLYINNIAAAGLQVKIIDLESCAIERVVKRLNGSNIQKIVAVLDVSAISMNLTVLQNHECLFIRNELLAQSEINNSEIILVKLKRMLQFFSSTHHHEIEQIFLAGEVKNLSKLMIEIERELKINVVKVNPFASMRLASNIDKEQMEDVAPSLLLSCGLALRNFTV